MRWKAFIPILVIVIVTFIIGFFMLDSIMKNIFIKTNESIFKAKTELASFDFSLKDFSIEITGYKVADKNNPMQNLFEIDKLRGELEFGALIEKKISINELSAMNVSFNTKRKISGALKKEERKKKKEKKKGKKSKLLGKLTDKLKFKLDFNLETLSKKFPIDEVLDSETLESIEKAKKMQGETTLRLDKLEKNIDGFKFQDELNEAKLAVKDMETVKDVKTLDDINAAKTKLERLDKSKDALQGKVRELNSLRKQVKDDKTYFTNTLKEIKSEVSKQADYKKILDKINLKEINTKNLSKGIFGENIFSKLETIIIWIKKLRRLKPKGAKEKEKRKVPYFKGITVQFPTKKTNARPKFLIKKIILSGQSQINGATTFKVEGIITGLTSNQDLYGKPTIINIKGSQRGSDPYSFIMKLILDYRGENRHKEDLALKLHDFNLKGRNLGTGKMLPPEFSKGSGTIDLNLKLSNHNYGAGYNIRLTNIAFDMKKASSSNEFEKILNDIYSNMKLLTFRGRIEKKEGGINFSLSSNLDNYFKNELKRILSNKTAEAKARVKQEIDKRINEQTDIINKEINQRLGELEERILGKNNILKKELNLEADEIAKYKDLLDKGHTSLINDQVKEKTKEATNAASKEIEKQKEKATKEANKFIKSLF